MSTTTTFALGLGCGAALWYLTKNKQSTPKVAPTSTPAPVATTPRVPRNRRGAR